MADAIKGFKIGGSVKLIDYVDGVTNKVDYATKADISAQTSADITALDLPNTYAGKGYETTVDTLVGSDTGKSVRTVASEEVAKIVASADTKYDTLKEIADYIASDIQSAATLANNITALSAVSASTRLTALEASAHTHTNKTVLDGITAQNVSDWSGKQDALSDTDGGYGQRIKAVEDVLASAINFEAQTY